MTIASDQWACLWSWSVSLGQLSLQSPGFQARYVCMFIEQQQNLPMQLVVWVEKGECCVEPFGWVMTIVLSHELLNPGQ